MELWTSTEVTHCYHGHCELNTYGFANTCRADVTDGIAAITPVHPDEFNAVNLELLSDLRDALVDLPEDAVDGLVLTGAGDVTCAGMDRDIVADPAYEEKYADEIGELTAEIYESLIPIHCNTAVSRTSRPVN